MQNFSPAKVSSFTAVFCFCFGTIFWFLAAGTRNRCSGDRSHQRWWNQPAGENITQYLRISSYQKFCKASLWSNIIVGVPSCLQACACWLHPPIDIRFLCLPFHPGTVSTLQASPPVQHTLQQSCQAGSTVTPLHTRIALVFRMRSPLASRGYSTILSFFPTFSEGSFWMLPMFLYPSLIHFDMLYCKVFCPSVLRQDPPPPLDLSFWSFLTFLHHGIEEVKRHLLWKFYKKNSKEKLVKCATEVGRLHRVSIQSCTQNRPSPKVHRSRGI